MMTPGLEAAHQEVAPSRIFEMFDRWPADRALLKLGNKTITYGHLSKTAARLAAGLAARGLKRGDRLAVFLPNGAEWWLVMAACSRLGVTALSLNVRLSGHEIASLIERTSCVGLVYSASYREGICTKALEAMEASQISSLRFLISSTASPGIIVNGRIIVALEELKAEAAQPVQAEPDDPYLILSTSGTTSIPKLVVHTQRRVCAHAHDAARALNLRAGSKLLLALPLCGIFGYAAAMAAVAAGATIILMEDFYPSVAAGLIREHGATHMVGTNDMLDKLLKCVDEDPPFPSLEVFVHANFTPGLNHLAATAERRKVLICGAFGMSEIFALFTLQERSAPLAKRNEGGGFAVNAGARIRIRESENGREAPTGKPGEIEVWSPNLMTGYLNDAELTARAFTSDGYFRTGDLGYLDQDGALIYLSRQNDVLRIGGYLVNPKEIEEIIKSDASVDACQVVAVTTAQGAARPVAFVVPNGEAREDELMTLCEKNLAKFKRPIRIFFLNEFPVVHSPNGAKIKVDVLREMAGNLLNEGK